MCRYNRKAQQARRAPDHGSKEDEDLPVVGRPEERWRECDLQLLRRVPRGGALQVDSSKQGQHGRDQVHGEGTEGEHRVRVPRGGREQGRDGPILGEHVSRESRGESR